MTTQFRREELDFNEPFLIAVAPKVPLANELFHYLSVRGICGLSGKHPDIKTSIFHVT